MSVLVPSPRPRATAASPAAALAPDASPVPGAADRGAQPFHDWTMSARVIGDRVVAKARCPGDGRVLSSGPQPTRAHAFAALREQIALSLAAE